MPPLLQLSILNLLIGWSAAVDFKVGEYVIVRNLKWKTDESIHDAVMQLNNSIAKIMSHNTHRSERDEFTVQSLEDPPVQLAVPRKKLQHLSRMMIYDYSASSHVWMMQKFNELIQNPLNHVCVLPVPRKSFEHIIQRRYGHLDHPNVLKLDKLTCSILFTRRCEYSTLGANELSNALQFMSRNIPNVLRSQLKQDMLKWAKRQNGGKYYLRILNADWTRAKCTPFAGDSDRNVIMIHKMREILRVIQSNHQCEAIRNMDWMLPMKRDIGDKVLEYWLSINDPKNHHRRQQLHVFWKWNDVDPKVEFIDIDPRSVFPLNPRVIITTDDNELYPKCNRLRNLMITVSSVLNVYLCWGFVFLYLCGLFVVSFRN